VAGFVFDIFTLSRIDDWLTIFLNGVYLFFSLLIIKYKALEIGKVWAPGPRTAKFWIYNNEALHFLLGSLLSSYTLFYFVSASFATSFVFLAFIFVILVINELPSIQQKGLGLKFTLYSLCFYSYLFVIVPLTLGFVGMLTFIISLLLGVGFFVLLFFNYKKIPLQDFDIKKNVLYPPLAVAAVLTALYIVKLLPPIPLSVQHMGIYHQVERRKSETPPGVTEFVLKYDRPAWRFWESGAQTFVAEPQDKINCFVRVFAPANFKDQVVYHFLKKSETRGWETQDKIVTDISGGRDAGFRSFVTKSNFEAGKWRVQLETTDRREIGRIGFTVEKTPTQNLVREFREDIY